MDNIAPLSARGSAGLGHLSDGELLESTRHLVGASNQILAALLLHLGEVEVRGIHRTRACASLYTYCIYELRFSEDAAFRRVSAARFVQRFPALVDAVQSGELHLTGLLMIGPHLTSENLVEVLARAKYRTKKELARLVRELDPLPDVPARIEPLGPALLPALRRNPSWAEVTQAHEGPVRELRPGERPRNWMSDAPLLVAQGAAPRDCQQAPPVAEAVVGANADNDSAPARANDAARLAPPQRYQVQFTATQEYVDLVERAQALLGQSSKEALAELHLQAVRALVAQLEKRKYAVTDHPAQRGDRGDVVDEVKADGGRVQDKVPRQRGRYIPAAVRREVFLRDGRRCTYVDDTEQRCRETHRLEFHHLDPFARGGAHRADNLTLRCRAHNCLAAEQDFGKEHVSKLSAGSAHEAFSRQR
jgi:hypothetical protein